MIHVYGTSHVSEESLELVDEKIKEHEPDIIALELDVPRLQGLLQDERPSEGSYMTRMIQMFQNQAGATTGVMPGDEMLYAYEKAVENDIDIGLIDQDIRVTMSKLQGIPRKEKFKLFYQLLLSFLTIGRSDFDISEIPEERLVEDLLEELKTELPQVYSVLVEQRNYYMVEALKQLQQENPGEDIVAFVGAAHEKFLREKLNEVSSEDSVESE